jgi:hypothetical protein
VWEETTAAHNTVGSMGEVMNGLIGGAAAIVDAVWDEDIVLAHGTSSSAGLLLRVLGAAISTRANNATLDALLGVTDAASTNLPDMIWDEDIVAAHSTTDTAGLLLRALGAVISQRSNNPTLDALLGVADTAAHDVPFTVWEEILSGNHVADSTGERLEALDVLTESGGAGDLADTNTQVQKIDSAATLTTPVAGSLADQIDTLVTLITGDRTIVASLNVEGTALRVEVGVEQFGVIQTTPWTQASAQIFDEDGLLIVNGTISIGDFGAINARGFFQHTILSHGLIAGKTYQMLVLITDGGSEQVTTTKIFKVIQG